MSDPPKIHDASGYDPPRSRLRSLLGEVERQIGRIDPTAKVDLAPLRASFAELSAQLALGAEPETDRCPKCNFIGMRGATRCGQCWAALNEAAPHA